MTHKYRNTSTSMANRVACRFFMADSAGLFKDKFTDLKTKIKKVKEVESEKIKVLLQKTLTSDLKSKGVRIESLTVSLGQYRGSKFVTSAKMSVRVKDGNAANALLKYLQEKYSPKYKLKKVSEPADDNSVVAEYNIR